MNDTGILAQEVKLGRERKQLAHALTLIAERCEELQTDRATGKLDPEEEWQAIEGMRKIARMTLDAAGFERGTL
jgi:hypothetical protein